MRLNRIKNKLSLLLTITLMLVTPFSKVAYSAVGANDGSAFITKAEFDAVVNTFNEQMDNYANNIVSKVDGAIANYLAAQSNIYKKTLKTNLDEEGNMKNGIKLTWSSSPDKVFGYNNLPNRIAIESFTFRYLYTNNNWSYGYANAYSWRNYDLKARLKYSDEFTVANRKYLSSKEVDITLDDGTKTQGYQRGKFATYLDWDLAEVQPYASSAPSSDWSPNPRFSIEQGISTINQKTKT